MGTGREKVLLDLQDLYKRNRNGRDWLQREKVDMGK